MGAPAPPRASRGFDLLALPGLGRFLRWRHARLALQLPVLAVSVAMVVHGFTGPQLAPRNLATVLTWVQYRGLLVLLLLVAGNLFCMACPFLLPRELARRFVRPVRSWPAALRTKWFAIALLAAVLFAYELFDLWSSPYWTAWLIVGYFGAALLVDAVFRDASFCKWICPIGQFNFVASTASPLEVTVREPAVCSACTTHDCITGRPAQPASATSPAAAPLRGCELALYLPRKIGNLDCTFCLDCVHACPHDNVAIAARLPASELWATGSRAGVGDIARSRDFAVLTTVFTFGALMNAFGMVSPVYAVQSWLASHWGLTGEAANLGVLFAAVLVVEPLLLLGLAALLTRRALPGPQRWPAVAVRFAPSLVPLGFGIWLAHYSFHLLTGLWTFVPVAQDALVHAGWPLLGQPRWGLGGIRDIYVMPIESCFLALGLVGTLVVAYRLAAREAPARPLAAFIPWAGLGLLLWTSAMWLLSQPMEMRATLLAS